jgi:hypothetical protein
MSITRTPEDLYGDLYGDPLEVIKRVAAALGPEPVFHPADPVPSLCRGRALLPGVA